MRMRHISLGLCARRSKGSRIFPKTFPKLLPDLGLNPVVATGVMIEIGRLGVLVPKQGLGADVAYLPALLT